MHNLEKLLKRFAKQRNARWWVGDRPDRREGEMGRMIATQVAYPTSTTDPFADGGMVRLTKEQAAHVLAVAGTTSLAYGKPLPPEGQFKDAWDALNDLIGDVTFLSNGLWDARASLSWNPLTSASVDCGVIGYDTKNAFIFWVEEED
jgi:hypothetical protein